MDDPKGLSSSLIQVAATTVAIAAPSKLELQPIFLKYKCLWDGPNESKINGTLVKFI